MKRIYDEQLLARAFPRYTDFDVIAQNEQGAVCKVWSRLDGFPVALKLTQDRGNPFTAARFDREYELLRTSMHPRILRVFSDRGRVQVPMPGGSLMMHFYFTMELCSSDVGHTLRRLSLSQRLVVVDQLFDGVRFLHVRGIAHRDIKPINVFLRGSPDQDGINVKIGDFGIAKDSSVAGKLSTIGIIGTPKYLAPERLEPTDLSRPASSSEWFPSDQYALGVTAFEILSAGENPFPFRKGFDFQQLDEVLKVHREGTRRPLVIPDLGRACPHVDRVLLRMMAPEVAKRYPDIHRSHHGLHHAYKLDGIARTT